MSLAQKSQATRKKNRSREERIAKRRQKFPRVPAAAVKDDGFASTEVELSEMDGHAVLVESTSQGGYHVEYLDSSGFSYSVPVEVVLALGFREPASTGKRTGKRRASK